MKTIVPVSGTVANRSPEFCRLSLILLFMAIAALPTLAQVTSTDGDWSAEYVALTNTPEAAFMVRVGDIDNLGFGWPSGFDPFSGNSTPGHGFPWTPGTNDPAGTDRIMVVSSYGVVPTPCGTDGYTTSTSRPDNSVQPIVLQYNLPAMTITNAVLQFFADDFQAPVWCANYQVTLNGRRVPLLEQVINQLTQTGPVGKLLTEPIPAEFLNEVASGQLSLKFDDTTTGAGDGYAIDFVKLLVNATSLPTGGVSGHVLDAVNNQPIAGAQVVSFDSTNLTDASGAYNLQGVPAGLAFVQASAKGYLNAGRSVDVVAGQTTSGVDFVLQRGPLVLSIDRLAVTPPAVNLSFIAFSGFSYTLQTATNLGQWMDDETIPGPGAEVSRTRPIANTRQFWRVKQN